MSCGGRISEMRNKMQTFFIAMILLANYCDGFIAPIEVQRWKENLFALPSILKGTDSRLGFGFRLGNHADFQSIFEIGPQKFTKPLEKRAEENYSSKKRMTNHNHHVRVTKMPRPESNLTKHYIKKPHFTIKNQYPLPKSLNKSGNTKKSEKPLRSIAIQKYNFQRKQPLYQPLPRTSRNETTLELRNTTVKFKKTQGTKNDT